MGPFFAGLAEQEQYHSELLEVCREATVRKGWRKTFQPLGSLSSPLEEQMDAAEAAVRKIDSIDEALRLVVQIESSEINAVFRAVVAATDVAFVKKLRPFRRIMEAHMSYIIERMPQLSPQLMAMPGNAGKIPPCEQLSTMGILSGLLKKSMLG